MSIQVNSRPRDFCPAECRFMKLSVDSEIVWGDSKAQMITNIVSCEYEDVCKMWAEREDAHRTCKGCKYDEANCTNPEPCVTNEFGGWTGYTRKETTAERRN